MKALHLIFECIIHHVGGSGLNAVHHLSHIALSQLDDLPRCRRSGENMTFCDSAFTILTWLAGFPAYGMHIPHTGDREYPSKQYKHSRARWTRKMVQF